jgi:hypothetical protein
LFLRDLAGFEHAPQNEVTPAFSPLGVLEGIIIIGALDHAHDQG